MKNIELKVNGMKCNGCENRIINVLNNIDGIKKVSASFKTGIVNIKCNKNVNIDTVVDTINSLGFKVEEAK